MRTIVAIIAEKMVSGWCSAIICVSANGKRLALKYHIADPTKILLIHNGVEIPLKNMHAPKREGVKVIFVGRLSEPKRPMWLLEAYRELDKNIRDKSEIHIIGEGKQREELETYIQLHDLGGSVVLHGALPRNEVLNELGGSDVFVFLSQYEGFPRSILEAMAAGLPIIASNVGGVSEAVSGDAGMIIKRNDKKALVDALSELINDPEKRIKMGVCAYERVRKEFSLDKMMQKTYEVYKNL
jgi:glycosyltransferase involved in cell wall biosynthesis